MSVKRKSYSADFNKYLISILNLKVLSFYIDKICHQYGTSGYLLSNQYIEQLPIPKISKEKQKSFEILVDKIMTLKEQDKDTLDLENKIDNMVMNCINCMMMKLL